MCYPIVMASRKSAFAPAGFVAATLLFVGCGSSTGGETLTDAGTAGASGMGSGGTGGGATGGSGGTVAAPCPGGTRQSGFETCMVGTETRIHRFAQEACGAPPSSCTPTPAGEPLSDCRTSSDCPEMNGRPGYCVPQSGRCDCRYSCLQDEDCPSGQICHCGSEGFGQCQRSDCTTDADCSAGLRCASYTADVCGIIEGFACQLPADECQQSDECGQTESCSFDAMAGIRRCVENYCACC